MDYRKTIDKRTYFQKQDDRHPLTYRDVNKEAYLRSHLSYSDRTEEEKEELSRAEEYTAEIFPESSFFDSGYALAAEESLKKVIDSGFCGGTSPFILEAENLLEEKLGRPVRLVSNGTVAIEASLRLSGVRSGDRVAVTARSFVATANAVLSIGAIPVFIGLDEDCMGISAEILDSALKENRDIRVVIAVHLYGYAPRISDVANVCKNNNCILIEDSAQGFGEYSGGRPLGAWGRFGTFSFFSNKVIACGEGGAIVCETAGDAARLDEMRYHGGKIEDGEFTSHTYGSNWRMNGLSAAVLCSSLKNMKTILVRRQLIARQYLKSSSQPLASRSSPLVVPKLIDGSPVSKWATIVRAPNGNNWDVESAKVIVNWLRRENVAARAGMDWLPSLAHLSKYECIGVPPSKFDRYIEILLPCHQGMDDESVRRVIGIYNSVYSKWLPLRNM